MVILKKIVIMTEYGKSNCSGIVKFENFAGRTSCFVRILGIKSGGVICIKCGEDVIYCGDLFEGEKRFNAIYDLNKIIQIAVLSDGSIVSLGSNRGRFSPNNILNDIHKYYAVKSGAVEQSVVQEEVKEDKVVNVILDEEENSDLQSIETASIDEAIVEVALSYDENQSNVVEEKESAEVIAMAEPKKKKSKPAKEVQPFYKKIEDNMSELFEKNDRDEELSLLIPDSKWARVSLGDDGYYVVGIIYSDDVPNIICYGVPDKDGANPPQSNENCRQWMEIEKGGRGYWMMYQSAQTGETLSDAGFGQ